MVLLLVTVSLACGQPAFAGNSSDTASFLGEVNRRTSNDTLYLEYHITARGFDPDSVVLWLDTCVVIYRRSEGVPFSDKFRTVSFQDGQVYYNGTIAVPTGGQPTTWWFYRFTGYFTNSDGVKQLLRESGSLSNAWLGAGMEIWFPSYGWFESSLPKPLDRTGPFLGWGMSIEYNKPKFRLSVSTSYSGFWSRFNFHEPLRFACRVWPGTRHNFIPSFYAAGKLTKLKFKSSNVEYREVEWGGEVGMAIEGPFERVGYHYSTALKGYHTWELYLALESAGDTRVGTRYLLTKAKDVWNVRVSFHFEGLWLPDGDFDGINRENKRPIPHKVLSVLGNPLGALYLLYESIN
jgi:hypothetical protein